MSILGEKIWDAATASASENIPSGLWLDLGDTNAQSLVVMVSITTQPRHCC